MRKLIICKKCGKERPHHAFECCQSCNNKERYKNDPKYRKRVKNYSDEYRQTPKYLKASHKRYVKARLKIQTVLCEIKSNGCAICGYDRSRRALHFHHVNPEDRKFAVNTAMFKLKKAEDFADEMNKCILLCSNCHMEIEDLEYKNEL